MRCGCASRRCFPLFVRSSCLLVNKTDLTFPIIAGRNGDSKHMGREHLERRNNWQAEAAERGGRAETIFHAIMQHYLIGMPFAGKLKPRELRGIYRRGNGLHGIAPDYVLRHQKTSKAVFVEIKRQRAAGNAHERACKFMMPGILNSARHIARQPVNVIPFWWIFSNGIASDPRYKREIMHWFQGIESHVLLWEDITDYTPVIDHFEQYIQPLLE